jgi:chemotaxis protein MotD
MRSDHSAQIDAVAVAVSTMPAVPVRSTQAADLPGGRSPAGLHVALSTGAGVSPVAAEPSQSTIGTTTEPAASTEAAAFRDAAPAKATVVAQQTHFAPAPIASAVGQIADAVMAEVPALVDQAAAPVEPGGSIPAAVVDRSPVRILTVRLDPPDLGEVTVHMRLKGESLDLRVVAADPGTAQLLNAQRDTLADLMCDSGYQADIANVQVAAADTSSAGSAGSQPGHGFDKSGSPPPGPADGRRNQAADQGGDPRAGSQGHSQTTSGRSDREDTVDRVTVRGGTVYV